MTMNRYLLVISYLICKSSLLFSLVGIQNNIFHLGLELDTVRASSVTYVMPVLAICWDSIFLHIKPGWNEINGAALILIGVLLTQVQKRI